MATAFPIDELPPELISHIFSFLEGPAASDTRLHDQPSPSMLSSPDTQTLKFVSQVSKRWRSLALPFLFRHVFWALDWWDIVFADAGKVDSTGKPTSLPLLSFIRENHLGHYVESLTLSVSDQKYGRYQLTGASGTSDTTAGSSRNEEFEGLNNLSIEDARARAGGISRWSRHGSRPEDCNWLWELLFEAMDPKRFTIIALPRLLASLLSTMLFVGDAWSFRDQCHILSLERGEPIERSFDWKFKRDADVKTLTKADDESPGPAKSRNCTNSTQLVPTKLFTIRPWTSLLLNEGSSTRVYKTYEFFHKRPPSILGALLGCEEAPNDKPLIPPTVRALSYVAIFPLSSHFNSLVSHLPPLDRLFIQLVPRNDILDDREEMRHIQVADLWMERNTCYSLVMRELFESTLDVDTNDEDSTPPRENGWRNLIVFESGDAADREAWDMAVEYVRMSGTPWNVEGDGVLVRHPERIRHQADSGADDEEHLQGAVFDDTTADAVLPETVDEGFELLSVTMPLSQP